MKKKILVVDDETSITRLLKLNLEGTGKYDVLEENEGKRALAAAQSFRPDLVLLDVMMPDADGGDVAAAMRGDHQLQTVPIVFLTAAVRKEEIDARGGMIGGFPYVAKPLDMKGVTAEIERHLGPG
jgi:DNA-binding response OmpR family regulator